MSESETMPRRIFPGWFMAACAFVSLMLMIGSTSYSFGAFVKPVATELGLARGTVNAGLIIFQLTVGLSAPVMGTLFDRFSLRWMVLICGLLFGAGYTLIGLSSSLWLIVVGVVLASLAAGGCGTLMSSTLVSRWFRRRRGLALGISSTGASMGGIAISPYMAYLIDGIGWRNALLTQAALVMGVLILMALLVIRDWPRDLGTTPDGLPEETVATAQSRADARLWSFRDLVVDPGFWLIAGAVGLIFGVQQAVVATFVPFGTDLGFSITEAASLVSMIAGTGLVGKLLFASVADRIDKRWALVAVAALNLSLALVMLTKPGYPTLLAATTLAGLGFGATLPVWAALVGARFGAASYGTAMGAMNVVNMALQASVVLFTGISFDLTQNYSLAFLAFAGSLLVAAGLILLLRLPRPVTPTAEIAASVA